jgi:hypothetical protein
MTAIHCREKAREKLKRDSPFSLGDKQVSLVYSQKDSDLPGRGKGKSFGKCRRLITGVKNYEF